MGLEFCSFASGSSGNSYMIRTENTALLLDCGIAGKHIIAGLDEEGMTMEDVDGILLTHEHSDHVKSIRMMGRKGKNATVYGSRGTFRAVEELLPQDRAQVVSDGERFTVGDIEVHSFAVSHDAREPLAYTFTYGKQKIGVMTDTGYISEEMYQEIHDADFLVLESNHEVGLLKMGPYPYSLKQRILSDYGHLSNDAAGCAIGRLLEEHQKTRMPRILLGHLSAQNNTPDIAMQTVTNILEEGNHFDGKDVSLRVAARSGKMPLVKLDAF